MPPRLSRRPRVPRVPRAAKIALASIAGFFVLIVAVAVVFALVIGRTYDSNRHVVDAFPAATDRPAPTTGKAAQAVNLLLLGTDTDTEDVESPEFVGKKEADTVMLLHVTADRSHVYAVSILRNSLVDVPGHGQQPINAAYAYGGVKLTVRAVEHLLNTRVDHVVDVSLNGVGDLTDALGGVTVNNPEPFTSDGQVFPAGRQRLNGERALAYLRAGDFRASGDSTRAGAQERYFKGVFQQILDARVLLDPAAIATTVGLFSPYLSTDRGFDSGTVASLGLSLRNVRGDDLRMLRVRQEGIGRAGSASVVLLDESALSDLRSALRSDHLERYAD